MDRALLLADKIKNMDSQFQVIESEINKDLEKQTKLEKQKRELEAQLAILELRLKKNNSIKIELQGIIEETKTSFQKISEAAETLMDIIDTKYAI
jgi:CII-binding regulator of phage lambda lysogenization HflD